MVKNLILVAVGFLLCGLSSSTLFSENANYVLSPSDLIRLEVYDEPDLQRELRIAADNSVSLPLIGRVELGGMTKAEAEKKIYQLYDRDYLVNPSINIIVLQFSEKSVQILGQVNRPGMVVIPPDKGLSLVEAIAGAGGFTRLADTRSVTLQRRNPDGARQTSVINVKEILSKSGKSSDLMLKEGDTLFVKERII